ncbi:uncharacterized protein CLUP02_17442 [Colletotrichum lupini]|uniref:Uncharacterized protein n=1 Tax=Colletotrichum lupini TaxID=145971 RepID=A0A9Q8SF44_9PEZI|nr:uncharacterized protein CLUP02_17442 [Colletotrichum lupini]UQC75933.1 hypothetical protein CLUP02_17442 [Colletotrichum lupini]
MYEVVDTQVYLGGDIWFTFGADFPQHGYLIGDCPPHIGIQHGKSQRWNAVCVTSYIFNVQNLKLSILAARISYLLAWQSSAGFASKQIGDSSQYSMKHNLTIKVLQYHEQGAMRYDPWPEDGGSRPLKYGELGCAASKLHQARLKRFLGPRTLDLALRMGRWAALPTGLYQNRNCSRSGAEQFPEPTCCLTTRWIPMSGFSGAPQPVGGSTKPQSKVPSSRRIPTYIRRMTETLIVQLDAFILQWRMTSDLESRGRFGPQPPPDFLWDMPVSFSTTRVLSRLGCSSLGDYQRDVRAADGILAIPTEGCRTLEASPPAWLGDNKRRHASSSRAQLEALAANT